MSQKSIKAYLDTDLHRQFKVECVKRDLHMSDVIAELIKEWLEKISKKDSGGKAIRANSKPPRSKPK